MLFGWKSKEIMSEVPAKQEQDPRSWVEKLRDVGIYFAIGVPFVVGVLYEADRTSGEPWLGVPLSAFVGATAIVFGIPLGKMRRQWGNPRLWLYATALIGVHCVMWITVLRIWTFGSHEASRELIIVPGMDGLPIIFPDKLEDLFIIAWVVEVILISLVLSVACEHSRTNDMDQEP